MNREIHVHVELHGETLPVGQLWSRSRRGRESASFRYYDFKSRQYWVTTHVRRKAIGKTSLDNDSWGVVAGSRAFCGNVDSLLSGHRARWLRVFVHFLAVGQA